MLTVDLHRAGVGPDVTVLDLGCGGGRHAFACLRAGATVLALDAAAGEVRQAAAMLAAMQEAGEAAPSGRAAALRGDAARVPLPDSSIDCVIAAEVLEHLNDDAGVLAELARVLRPGGVLAVSVPRFGPELVNWALSERYHSVEGGHVRIYRRRQIARRLRAAGFEPVASHHAHGLHSPYWWLRCLVGVERDSQVLVAAYHRLLVWDIERRPLVTRLAERVLDPLIGKSYVCYALRRSGGAGEPGAAADRRAARSRREGFFDPRRVAGTGTSRVDAGRGPSRAGSGERDRRVLSGAP